MLFGYLILIIAILISAIAAYYSVVGLTAIFAAAVIPVMIMGGALEAGKIAATVWLHNNWQRAGWAFKTYLVPAIVFLMLLTSMGIFGFLSKAHSDQSLVSGDVQSKIAIYDEKIKTQKENIEANRKALKQMDEGVDQVLGRSTDEKGADKAVALRRAQQKERARLQNEILQSQKSIAELNEARAPIAAEVRKVDAEVGPIKYIAALIYGDNPDQNLLEAAVRWVIILIVVVFDPLALTLILAGNRQLEWAREDKEQKDKEFNEKFIELKTEEPKDFSLFQWSKPPTEEKQDQALVVEEAEPDTVNTVDHGNCPKCETPIQMAPGIGPFCPNKECDVIDNIELAKQELEDKQLEEFFWRGRMIAKGLDADEAARTADEANNKLAEVEPDITDYDIIADQAQQLAEQENFVKQLQQERDQLQEALNTLAAEYDRLNNHLPDVEQYRNQLQADLSEKATALEHEVKNRETIELQLQQMQTWVDQLENDLREAVQLAHDKSQELVELKAAQVDEQPSDTDLIGFIGARPDEDLDGTETRATFGTEFPRNQKKGDMFLRVDYLPSRLFKWNGTKWIEIDKENTDRYAYDHAYIKLLVEKLQRGEYDPDDLNETERAQVAEYLKNPPGDA